MKTVIIILLLMCGSVTPYAYAHVAPGNLQTDKEKITAAQLPAAIKKTLATKPYRSWLVVSAYRIKPSNSYEIALKNGTQLKTLRLNEQGEERE